VASFRLALLEMDKLGGETGRIELIPTADDYLVFDEICIALPTACTGLGEKHVVIHSVERVLNVGERRGGKTTFFTEIAGLWPWGCGRILLPPAQTLMFVSQQDYLPPAALQRMKLGHLLPGLDRVGLGERELPREDQHKLAFARLLIHKPRWNCSTKPSITLTTIRAAWTLMCLDRNWRR
jgi:vitamin B12/bleomycin/antimicrobial peptide transport system ATP-binding/permease protein